MNKENVSKEDNQEEVVTNRTGHQPPESLDSKRFLFEDRKKAMINRYYKRTDSNDLLDY